MTMKSSEEWMLKYNGWLNDALIDEHTKEELRAISGDEKEIADRFYRDLQFGTGGLRGVIGAGTNRMNAYTVGKATQGLAEWLLARHATDAAAPPSVVIAHDSRHFSPEFALEAALVLAGNGVKAYLFDSLRSTPQLSYSVRLLNASAGIVITASHNPPEYNGYKAYGADGGQLIPEEAEQVIEAIAHVTGFHAVKRVSKEQAIAAGLLEYLDEKADESYIETVAALSLCGDLLQGELGDAFNIVFTPLHGAGHMAVRETLKKIGFRQVHIVSEQRDPDGSFPTVKSPNPEEKDAFALALKLAEEVQADIIVGTDPDADRMGAIVKNKSGSYEVLSGNQSGALMIYYILEQLQRQNRLPDNGVVIKTVVTSELGAVVAQSFGASVENTLTGFKYIGEKMTRYEQTKERSFLFGYEESYGYLTGDYARDKDAIVATMLICEAAAYYSKQGKTLVDVLEELYERFGYYKESQQSRTLKGMDGVAQIAAIMEDWRTAPPAAAAGSSVVQALDYSQGIDGLRKENVLKFILADGSWFCLRPSGTEPKIKVYFAVKGQTAAEADTRMQSLQTEVMARVDRLS